MTPQARLRELPSVHTLVERLADLTGRYPRELMVNEARLIIEHARAMLREGEDTPDVEGELRQALARLNRTSLTRVINATGVVLHTNLGRAPLAEAEPVRGYCNLEYDLAAGSRGKRDTHAAWLLEKALGAHGIVVNNNAAAVYLALRELAAEGEVIVSRGELIEIGDGFRIPDIMKESGAQLREVGTTNRTRLDDYADAITERTRLILIVHPSNFGMSGFTEKPARKDLAALGQERGIPVYEDIGSGCLADLRDFGIEEPRPQEVLAAGVNLVSFSADKLMGGPQAGILAGDGALVHRIRKNPMYRALRVDKVTLRALETTLRHTLLEKWDQLPAIQMIRIPAQEIRSRAEDMAVGIPADIIAGESVIGGGSTPDKRLAAYLVAVRCDANKVDERLRKSDPPVVARIDGGRLLIDLRTVAPEEEPELRRALVAALGD